MYKLYNVKTWGSVAPHLLLEELEVPYTNVWMTPEQVRAPEYRDLSPLGLIPALGLSDGRTLFESAAIVTHLVIAHPAKAMSPPPGSDDFGEFLSWLHLLSTNVYPLTGITFGGSAYALTPEQDAHMTAAANGRWDVLWGLVEARLSAEGPWLMGETYSALDLYAFMLCLWARPTEAEFLARFPAVAHLAAAVRARPRLKAALEAHGIMQAGGYGA
jgi:glutathione S-transferase